MVKWYSLILVILFSLSCSSESNDNKEKEQDKTNTKVEIFTPEILSKAGITLDFVSEENFLAIPRPDEALYALKKLCAQSQGYQSETWEGINECSWAIEKERINQVGQIVQRTGNVLQLNTDSGLVEFENIPEVTQGSIYYQFKGYFPDSRRFQIERIPDNKCPKTYLVNAKDGEKYEFSGTLIPSEDGSHFVVFNPVVSDDVVCSTKIEWYKVDADNIEKQWLLPLQKKEIQAIRLDGNKSVYLRLRDKSDTEKEDIFVRLSI